MGILEVFCKGDLKKTGDRENIDIGKDEFKSWVNAKWSLAPERDMKKYGHPAMFPEKLVERALKLFSFKLTLFSIPSTEQVPLLIFPVFSIEDMLESIVRRSTARLPGSASWTDRDCCKKLVGCLASRSKDRVYGGSVRSAKGKIL